MKVLKGLIIVSIVFCIFGCSTPTLAPPNVRQKEYVFESRLDKKSSYSKILIWASKNAGDSNQTIKLKDPDAAVIIIKGNIACDPFKMGNGYGQSPHLDMTVEIRIEDRKVMVQISDIVGRSLGSYDDGNRPDTKAQAELSFNECVDPFVDQIKAELN